jgi:CRISPR-associated protein Cas2
MPHLLAYDIADDGRRYRAARVLLDYGERVQESVFWLDIDAELCERMWTRLRHVILGDEDVVWLVPVCHACAKDVRTTGKTRVPEVPEFYVL